MQHSPCVGNRPQRSNSPVFFTGCTASLSNTVKVAKDISSQDFENLKLSVAACNSMNTRHGLLPLPKNNEANASADNETSNLMSVNLELATSRNNLREQKPLQTTYSSVNESCSHRETANTYLLQNPNEVCMFHNRNTNESFKHKSSNRKRKNVSPDRASKLPRRIFPVSEHRYTWEQLSQDIWHLYMQNKQTPEVYRMKMALRDQLHQMLLSTFPSCGLYVVGSSMTGLGANSSDMDMCLMLSHSEIDQEQEATGILQTVYETFVQYDFLTNVELIPAKVPILRFKDLQTAIEVDLNINNSVGIRNTQLLTSYSRMDKRVPPLVLLTKLWARCHGINNAKNHMLSSYSLVLMVIHYLQCGCSPPVLPCLQILQPEKFQSHSDVRTLSLEEELPNFVSNNFDQLSELFLGFLDYFANKFDFQTQVMSVRIGGVLPKHIAMNNTMSPKNKRGHWKHICIEEPFNLTNTACSVFKDSAFYYMRDVFLRSWNLLRSSGKLSSILDLEPQ